MRVTITIDRACIFPTFHWTKSWFLRPVRVIHATNLFNRKRSFPLPATFSMIIGAHLLETIHLVSSAFISFNLHGSGEPSLPSAPKKAAGLAFLWFLLLGRTVPRSFILDTHFLISIFIFVNDPLGIYPDPCLFTFSSFYYNSSFFFLPKEGLKINYFYLDSYPFEQSR